MSDPSSTNTTPSLVLPSGFEVKCVDGCAKGKARDTARTALLAVMKGNGEWRRAGIWSSMFLRTSKRRVDVVYSMMGLFGVDVDPYREDRELQYLFNVLTSKTAAKGRPGWLGVGGLGGSLIVRDSTSRLTPVVPIYENQEPPVYELVDSGKRLPAGEFVDGSSNYIKMFDTIFVTSSQPHMICPRMFDF